MTTQVNKIYIIKMWLKTVSKTRETQDKRKNEQSNAHHQLTAEMIKIIIRRPSKKKKQTTR